MSIITTVQSSIVENSSLIINLMDPYYSSYQSPELCIAVCGPERSITVSLQPYARHALLCKLYTTLITAIAATKQVQVSTDSPAHALYQHTDKMITYFFQHLSHTHSRHLCCGVQTTVTALLTILVNDTTLKNVLHCSWTMAN